MIWPLQDNRRVLRIQGTSPEKISNLGNYLSRFIVHIRGGDDERLELDPPEHHAGHLAARRERLRSDHPETGRCRYGKDLCLRNPLQLSESTRHERLHPEDRWLSHTEARRQEKNLLHSDSRREPGTSQSPAYAASHLG